MSRISVETTPISYTGGVEPVLGAGKLVALAIAPTEIGGVILPPELQDALGDHVLAVAEPVISGDQRALGAA